MELTEQQIERYSRHIILKDVGGKGQQRLLAGRVLIIGAGGLGCPVGLYLAAAGVGTIGIVDADTVDLSNLQRQVAHFTADIDRSKVDSLAEKLLAINPDLNVVRFYERATASNIADLISAFEFVIDGTDNFAAKFLINDACVLGHKSFSHAGILGFKGQLLTYTPGNACYRCVFRQPPPKGAVPSCSEAGVLGAIAGVTGTLQATEALKHLLGKGDLLTNRLLTFDAMTMKFREVALRRNATCPICGEDPQIKSLHDEEPAVCALRTGGADS